MKTQAVLDSFSVIRDFLECYVGQGISYYYSNSINLYDAACVCKSWNLNQAGIGINIYINFKLKYQ